MSLWAVLTYSDLVGAIVSKARWARHALWMAAGMVVGGAVVFGVLRFLGSGSPGPSSSAPPVLTQEVPKAPAASPEEKAEPGPKIEGDPASLFASLFPFFQFASGELQPSQVTTLGPPSPLTGEIRGSTSEQLEGDPMGLQPVSPPAPSQAAPDVRLVLISISDRNSPLGKSELEDIVNGAAASVRSYSEFGGPELTEREGVLVLIPEKRVADLLASIKKLEPGASEVSWKGPSEARQSRLIGEIELQIIELKAKRQQLLIRYLEEAPQVVDIDEALVRAKQSLAKLRIEKELTGMAAVRVTFPARR